MMSMCEMWDEKLQFIQLLSLFTLFKILYFRVIEREISNIEISEGLKLAVFINADLIFMS